MGKKMKYYLAIKRSEVLITCYHMNLENMLSEEIQTQKAIYHMTQFV